METATAIMSNATRNAGTSAGTNGSLKRKCMSPHAPATLKRTPARLPSDPSSTYSASITRPTWRRVAPSTLSNTPSRNRSRRVALTALKSTGMPSARLNAAMNRMAVVTLSSTRPMVCCTSVRSRLATFG